MSACGPRDPGAEALSASRGSAPPFLPTLVTALAIGLVSLLCRAPSAPETPAAPVVSAQASPAGADGFHPAMPGAEVPAMPATLAFARLHPLTLHLPQLVEAETGKTTSSRVKSAASAARRPCAPGRCGETRRAETAARPSPPPARAASEPEAVPAPLRRPSEADEDLMPPGALPFAATAASLVDRARRVGGSVTDGAASLGGSVVELLASAR